MNKLNINSRAKKYRTSFLTGVILLSCLISLPLCAEESLTILYTGSVLGELKPCGCSEVGDLGGILRRASVIENERAGNKNILLLDAGDSFKEPTEQGKLKAKSIIESLSKMNYDAAIPGERDFIYGEELINLGAFDHWVLSNLHNEDIEQRKTLKYYIKDATEHIKIAVIGLIGNDLLNLEGQTRFRVENPFFALKKVLQEIQKNESPNIILLLTHMEKEKAQELFSFKEVNIIINGHLDEEERIVPVAMENNRILAHVRERGQYIGKMTLTLGKSKIESISNEYIPLTPAIRDSDSVKAIYDKYNEDAKQLFLNWLKDKKRTKNSPFASSDACKECHEEAFSIWEKSDHAHAFNSLKKVFKTFDPECLLCHTTAFKEDGGFLSENITPNLTNVQCEVCHGAGQEHRSDNLSKPYGKVDDKTCLRCHTRENSPGFNFSEYWKTIEH